MLQETSLRRWFVTVVLFAPSLVLANWEPIEIRGLGYPRLAQLARLEGIVVVECAINRDGTVKTAEVESGHPVLGKAAAEVAKTWRFKASRDGHRKRTMRLTFEFRLVGQCRTQCCAERLLLRYPDYVLITSELPSIETTGAGPIGGDPERTCPDRDEPNGESRK